MSTNALQAQRKNSLITNSGSKFPISKSLNKLSTELPPLNPEIYLSRSSIFEQDKKKNLESFLNQKTHRDISHFFDSDHINRKAKSSRSKSIYSAYQDINKRMPTSKVELENLQTWLNEVKISQISEFPEMMNKGIATSEVIEKTEKIYSQALEELVKQVSVQCKPRGHLLKNVIKVLKFLWKIDPESRQGGLAQEREKYFSQLRIMKEKCEEKVKIHEIEKVALEKNFEFLIGERDGLAKEIKELKKSVKKTHWEHEDFLRYKANRMKLRSRCSQTDPIEEAHTEENSCMSSPEIVIENAEAEKKETEITEPEKEIEVVDNQEEKEKFIIEFKGLIQNVEISQDIDMENLIETVANETKDFTCWLNGFKMALSLARPHRETVKSYLAPSDTSYLKSENFASTSQSKITSPRRTQTTKFNHFDTYKNFKEQVNSVGILSNIMAKPMNSLQKYSKTTKKKILKQIAHYIYLGIGSKYLKKPERFSDVILLSLFNKYNIKSIAKRKFKELLVGCLVYCQESLRIKLFLRSIGAGSYVELKNFSLETCEMCLKTFEFMITSKIGVIFDSSDPLSIDFYPTSRAIECAKAKFEEIYNKTQFQQLISQIELNSEPDFHRVNKAGVISLDLFIEILAKSHSEFQESINSAVSFATELLTDYNYLTRSEVVVLFRHLAPTKQFLTKKLKFDEKNEIDLNEFKKFCTEFGLLNSETVINFFESHDEEVWEDSDEEKVVEIVNQGKCESFTVEEWEILFEEVKRKKDLKLKILLKQEILFVKNS